MSSHPTVTRPQALEAVAEAARSLMSWDWQALLVDDANTCDAMGDADALSKALRTLDALPTAPAAAAPPTVEIVSVDSATDCGPGVEKLAVFIDGELVAFHAYGGEPEDNCRSRDYHWVEPLLRLVAERCGAAVKVRALEGDWNEKLSVEDAIAAIEKAGAP